MKSGIKNNIMTVVTLDLYALLSYRTMTVGSESRPQCVFLEDSYTFHVHPSCISHARFIRTG